jgi:hypothetical protein
MVELSTEAMSWIDGQILICKKSECYEELETLYYLRGLVEQVVEE